MTSSKSWLALADASAVVDRQSVRLMPFGKNAWQLYMKSTKTCHCANHMKILRLSPFIKIFLVNLSAKKLTSSCIPLIPKLQNLITSIKSITNFLPQQKLLLWFFSVCALMIMIIIIIDFCEYLW